MVRGRVLGAFAMIALLSACATPQIRTTSETMAMEVAVKTPLIAAVAYSLDGRKVMTGNSDSAARVWDLAAGRQTAIFHSRTGMVDSLAVSPDGKTLAVGTLGGLTIFSDHATTLWDLATGKQLTRIERLSEGLSFSPDGRYLIGKKQEVFGGTFELREMPAGRLVRELKAYRGKFSPGGKHMALLDLVDEGNVLISDYVYYLSLVSSPAGETVWKRGVGDCDLPEFSPNGEQILLVCNRRENGAADLDVSFKLIDARTGKDLREFGRTTTPAGLFSVDFVFHMIGAIAFSPDGKTFISGDLAGRYTLWDLAAENPIRQLKTVDEITGAMGLNVSPSIQFAPDGRTAVAASLASTRVYDIASGEELATFIAFEDGEWLVTTPSGYYNASEKGDDYLRVSIAGVPYTISQMRESFFRPDLVKLSVAGGSLQKYKRAADVRPPPSVTIIETPSTAAADLITVTLQIRDQGGGVGDVRLYRNGAAVVFEKARAVPPSGARDDRVMQLPLRLEPGKNVVRAIAFNADNSMQSTGASVDIQSNAATRQPRLHAVVVGIKDYQNPKLALTYPVADAELFAATLEKMGKGLFSSFHIRRLLLPAETTSAAITAALQAARNEVHPEDLFVFYVASHGTVDDGQYFLVTSNVGSASSARLKADALSQDSLKEMISNIPASKKLIVLDTCNAGQLGDVLQSSLLTRGMSEETAVKVLSRAVGSTILSASTSVQEALEGYRNHGLFTWVVVEGLNGAADTDRDGFVKTLELADYVDNHVPEIAERVFRHKQYPIVSPSGQGFPVAKVQ
jgi:WD40 repeat protein